MAGIHADNECVSIEDDDPYLQQPESERPPLESIEATFSDGADEVTYYTGYSALQIATKRAEEIGGAHLRQQHLSRDQAQRPESTHQLCGVQDTRLHADAAGRGVRPCVPLLLAAPPVLRSKAEMDASDQRLGA